MQTTRYGTAHFHSRKAANAYYALQGFSANDVQTKLDEGEIFIGPPMVYRGARLSLVEGRYFVEERS